MSIHQEAIIDAAPERVYAVLTDGERFAAATGQPASMTISPRRTSSPSGGVRCVIFSQQLLLRAEPKRTIWRSRESCGNIRTEILS